MVNIATKNFQYNDFNFLQVCYGIETERRRRTRALARAHCAGPFRSWNLPVRGGNEMQMTHGDSSQTGRPQGALRLSDRAPGFAARTTLGPRSLRDYRGSWLMFFSHPADFTPVCTTEFMAIARAAPRFEAIGCQLLALSVDSLYSHIAWLRDIEARTGLVVPFPVIEDPSMVIASAYGMLDPEASSSATVRATYVIDPEGLIRAMSWYPMNVGRSVEELLRLVAALQAADREAASAPEGWRPGAPMLEPGALTLEEAATREQEGRPWYMAERQP